MIDLSKFVDKKVRVTFRNGCICEGEVSLTTSMNRVYNPYYFKNNAYECSFTLEGFELDSDEPTAGDIVKIEEIETTNMNQYQQTNVQNTKMSKTPQTISDFIALLTAVKEKYGDLKVRRVYEDYVNDCDEYYEFTDIVVNSPQSLIYDTNNNDESYLLFVYD